jgi:hypothetical protein
MPKAKEVSVDVKASVKALIKAKSPAIFEREPAPAFAEGNLDRLVDSIMELVS